MSLSSCWVSWVFLLQKRVNPSHSWHELDTCDWTIKRLARLEDKPSLFKHRFCKDIAISPSRKLVQLRNFGRDQEITCLSFSPDGTYIGMCICLVIFIIMWYLANRSTVQDIESWNISLMRIINEGKASAHKPHCNWSWFSSYILSMVATYCTRHVILLKLGSVLKTKICFAGAGFSSGRVMILDGLILTDCGENETKSDFFHCHDSITRVVFSYDCRYMACSVSFLILQISRGVLPLLPRIHCYCTACSTLSLAETRDHFTASYIQSFAVLS